MTQLSDALHGGLLRSAWPAPPGNHHCFKTFSKAFKKGERPQGGLAYVDRNGGYNPLTFVVSAANSERLDNKEEYEKMWNVEDALEQHKELGRALTAGPDG